MYVSVGKCGKIGNIFQNKVQMSILRPLNWPTIHQTGFTFVLITVVSFTYLIRKFIFQSLEKPCSTKILQITWGFFFSRVPSSPLKWNKLRVFHHVSRLSRRFCMWSAFVFTNKLSILACFWIGTHIFLKYWDF